MNNLKVICLITLARSGSKLLYSLFDSHNSFIPFAKFGHTISFLSNQIIKRSPINIRKFIGICIIISNSCSYFFCFYKTAL